MTALQHKLLKTALVSWYHSECTQDILDLVLVVITQQFTSIAKPFRENISKLVIFYNPSKKDMQTITDEFLNVEKEEIKDITQKLKNNKHSRLEILLRHPFTHEVITPNK